MSWGSEWGDERNRSTATVETFGKIPVTVVELRLDVCQHYFGNTPCTASAAHGSECYRTRATCQDTANYAVKSTPEVYRFLSKDSPLITGFDAWRCVVSVSGAQTSIDQRKGLPGHSSVTIKLEEFADPIDLPDPYRHRRASKGGGFFAKLLERNRHYRGRQVWVREGFLTRDGTLLLGALTLRRYIIEEITRDSTGGVTIKGKSVLKRLDDVKLPAETYGRLSAAMTAGSLSFTIEDDGAADSYPTTAHYVRIGDEIMAVTRSDTTFTVTEREVQGTGTSAVAHAIGDGVQLCQVYLAQDPDDVLVDLLTEAGVDASMIDSRGFADEVDYWLVGHPLTIYESTPTSLADWVRTILRSLNLYMWWDDEAGKIRLKHIAPLRPTETATALSESDILDKPALAVKEATELQLSRQSIAFGVRDWSQDYRSKSERLSRYKTHAVRVDADAETAAENDRELSGEPILAYPVPSTLATEMQALAFRLVSRNRLPPKVLTWAMEARKASARKPGDVVDVTHRDLVDKTGTATATEVLITGKKRAGNFQGVWEFQGITTGLDDRWCFLHTTSAADYDSATDTEKRYGYLAGSDELVEGDPPYLLI